MYTRWTLWVVEEGNLLYSFIKSVQFYDDCFLQMKRVSLVNTTTQEISTDYDHDSNPAIVFDEAFGDDSDRLASDNQEAETLSNELDQLLGAVVAVESFGMNPTAFGIMQSAGLLNGTSLNALAMENFQYDKPEGDESEMVVEALVGKIKEKAAQWSAKILTVIKNAADKILNVIGGLWTKVSDLTKTLTSKAWDKTKAVGTVIKAHPYKTVMAAVIAAAAVGAFIMWFGNHAQPDMNENQLQAWVNTAKQLLGPCGSPLGRMELTETVRGSKLSYVWHAGEETVTVAKTASELSWSSSAVKAMSGQLGKAWSSLKSGASLMTGKVVNLGIKLNDIGDPGAATKELVTQKTGSKITGWMSQQLANKAIGGVFWTMIAIITSLLKNVVAKAFNMVHDTFNSLKQEVVTV